MIDTHCHLLAGVDDGPGTTSESLRMARALVTAGVKVVICTPHYSRRYPTENELALAVCKRLRERLSADGIDLVTGVAAEFSPALALEVPGDELLARTLGNGYLLVELEPDTPPGAVELITERLGDLDLLPVLAHPERCRAVRSQPRVLDEARSAGALVQVVARSLETTSSRGVAGSAWSLLDSGRVDMVASDSHRAEQAGSRLAAVLAEVGRRYGPEALEGLTVTAPTRALGLGESVR